MESDTNKYIEETLKNKTTIMSMHYFSATMPSEINNEIIRRNYLDHCDEALKENNCVCLNGEDGVGVTTILTQFVKKHPQNCVSYFYNGLDRICLNPEVIEKSLVEQLYWFVYGEEDNFDIYKSNNCTLESLYTYVLLKIKKTNQHLYFVFDGFNDIPLETLEGLKKIFSKILWNEARFIFSGDVENIRSLLHSRANIKTCNTEIMRFAEADVKEYFKSINSNITDEQCKQLYDITKGNGHRMDIVRSNYILKDKLQDLFNSDITGESDLYDEDFSHLFEENDIIAKDLFALLAYAEFPLSYSMVSEILDISISEEDVLIKRYKEYIVVQKDQNINLKSEGFHKYLRVKMLPLKQKIELKVIEKFENSETPFDSCNYLPAIYKSTNNIDKLVNYLNSNNVQQILINKQSQAALNEQCNFGYEACKTNIDKYLSNMFRFALNKSTSIEIEKNELWDYEIEALLSVGNVEQAIALANSIYLKEEKLKSYLLIAKKKKELQDDDYSVVIENINQLVKSIDFELIPDKAMELVKLLMPVDYEAATDIIDRISRKYKGSVSADRIYALLSLAYNRENIGNVTNFDLVNSKIQDQSLRSFAHTAKNLFTDVSVDHFLEEIDKLPKNSQKLYFLQYWLPEHEKKEGVGRAVLEAIRLIVVESNTEIPRAKVLDRICHSMYVMSSEEMEKAMVFIESMEDSIKFPTFDYVDAEISVIKAIKDKLPEKAKSHLEDLYLYILYLKDESVKVTCLSKLLGNYDYLGNRKVIDKEIVSSVDLRNYIISGIKKILKETAYHMKIVEGPIKALVSNYSTMIDELIQDVNTVERKSRAYSYAACQYLLCEDEKKIKLDYFFGLLSKAQNIYEDVQKPLLILSELLVYGNDINHIKFLDEIKTNFKYIENLESAKEKCVVCMRIYIWLKKNIPSDTFANRVKNLTLSSWESIDIIWFKIEIGFLLAKNFAKISKEESCELIKKCSSLKKNCLLASSSCVISYRETLGLYTLSLCNLIRLNLCDDKILHQFSEDIDNILSKSELAEIWGNISIEYLLADKSQKFTSIGDKYIPIDYSQFSVLDQKCIIYQISPTLFYRNQFEFFKLLSKYDKFFMNDCILHVCYFIITKQTLLSTSPSHTDYDLSFTDYTNLLLLLDKSTNDENFFNVIIIICKSLKVINQRCLVLSLDQKKSVIAEANRIIENNLPTKYGIKHEGYKIACQAALANVERDFISKDRDTWINKIESIDNKADKAFLYILIAPYFSKRVDQDYFFREGIIISESIDSTYDKVNRLDMSISECLDNNLGTLVPQIAKSAMASLANNGDLDDHKRLIDMAYQHNPELAEQLINTLDKDPARKMYKQKLLYHINSVKKLEKAKKEMNNISDLTVTEQVDFFEKLLENLLSGKGQLQNVSDVFKLSMEHVFKNSIVDTKAAIIYLMETVCKKHLQSKNQSDLLYSIHNSIRYNLKMALSLSAGSKESLYKIENMINENNIECDGLIPIGKYEKAESYLLNWCKKTGLNELVIIDPYFSPKDLYLIKKLCDLNVDLKIKILAHKGKNEYHDFKTYWRKICSGIKCPITLNFVSYKDKPESGPLHDRYWICNDDDKNIHVGIETNSISGYGKKESSITKLTPEIASSILYNSYVQYVLIKANTKEGKALQYYQMILE